MRVKLHPLTALEAPAKAGEYGELLVREGKGQLLIQNTVAGGVSLDPVGFAITAPSVTSPLDGAGGFTTAPVVTASTMSGDGTHVASYWRVATDAAMSTLVVDTSRDTANLTSLDLTSLGLTLIQGTTYYIQVRYESNLAPLSSWSPVISFSTLADVLSTETDIVYASDAAGGDRFGQSVALSADGLTLAVGSYLQTDAGTDGGKVYIYKWDAPTLKWIEDAAFTGSDTQSGDFFGYSVSLNDVGDVLAVGAYMHDGGNAPAEGAIYIFLDGGGGNNWSEDVKMLATGNQDDQLGISVSISDDGLWLAAGSDLNPANGNSSGAVYTWDPDNRDFTDGKENEVLANNTTTGDRFGTSVSMAGDASRLFVGAYLSDDAGQTDAGAVFVFSPDGGGGYNEDDVLYPPTPELYGYFGYSVDSSTDGNTVVIGAYGEDATATSAGAIYVFTYDTVNGAWDSGTRLVPSGLSASDAFGRSVAISGDGLLIIAGAYGANVYAGDFSIFSKATGTWVQAGTSVSASNATSYDYVGISTSLSADGSVGAVGAFGEGTNGNEAGAVYTYA